MTTGRWRAGKRGELPYRDPASFSVSPVACRHEECRGIDHGYEDDDGTWLANLQLETVTTYKDIDLHRMQCQLCGHIDYYSARAQIAWETGKNDPGIRCWVTPIIVSEGPRI